MMAVACSVLCLAINGHASYYGTFGHYQGMSLLRGMSNSVDAHALVYVRIALEHPSAFLLVGCDDDEVRCALTCVPDGPHVHRVEGMWMRDTTTAREIVPSVRSWHAQTFRNVALLPGKLRQHDLNAFDP